MTHPPVEMLDDDRVGEAYILLQEKMGVASGLTRKDGRTPASVHPERVAKFLFDAGLRDPDILAAALLHDVVEDTDVNVGDILTHFGNTTATLVDTLTHNKERMTKKAYLSSFAKAHRAACLIKMVDRADNLNDWSGLSPAYRMVYALQGLRLLADCLENDGDEVYAYGFKQAWGAAASNLLKTCGKHLGVES